MVEVKVCGLTRVEDMLLAAELGANYLGFIFAPSPRQVSVTQVQSMIRELDATGFRKSVKTVAVFVNEASQKMEQVLDKCGIDFAQIHGDETVAETNDFNFPWYRALRVGSVKDYDRLCPAGGKEWRGEILLADASVKGVYGGSGVSVPVETAGYVCRMAHAAGKKFFLAGGLRPDNIAQLVAAVAPDGVDVSSGVEASPGVKDSMKMRAFFEALQSV